MIFFLSCISLDASVGDAAQGPGLFDFDHVHFDSKAGTPVAVLYGAVGTGCFREFHLSLAQAAKEVSLFCYCLDKISSSFFRDSVSYRVSAFVV